MYLCKALLNVCIYDKGAIKIRYNNIIIITNVQTALTLQSSCTHIETGRHRFESRICIDLNDCYKE